MEIKQLRYFLAVSDDLSFTKAASRLGVAQPAVSMSIQKLEHDLALTLLHRADRKVSLTDEGRALYQYAQRIIQTHDDAELEMNERRGLVKGDVRIGISSMLGSYYFPPILMAFKHQYPMLNLEVIEGGTSDLQHKIEKGEIDLGVVVAEDVPDSLEMRSILTEEMLVTVDETHAFTELEKITPEQFFSQELVMFKQGYFHRKAVDRLAKETGASLNIGFETNLLPLIKSIIKQGFGISTLLAMVTQDDEALITRPFDPPIFLDLNIAWRKHGYLSHANKAFLDFLLAYTLTQKKDL